ncbi:MAG: hypothetical protein KDK91_02970, partial [Gammaproteobacteria bacterium]|nr:hypothetical protein [Gammaproteobacteria bacterium]
MKRQFSFARAWRLMPLLWALCLAGLPLWASAQPNLWFVSAVPTLSGEHSDGIYRGDTATLEVELSITAQVLVPEDRRRFRADVHLVGIDETDCSNLLALPEDCEHLLTSTTFDIDEIEVRTQPTGARKRLSLRLSEPGVSALDTFAARQRSKGRSLRFRVTLDTTGVYADDPVPSDNIGASAIVALLPLSGDLLLGEIVAQLQHYTGQSDCFGAPGLQVLSAAATWLPGTSGNWPPHVLQFNASHCMEPVLSAQELIDLRLSQGIAIVSPVTGSLAGMDVEFASVLFTPGGGLLGDLTLTLPDNTSFHRTAQPGGGPRARGSGTLEAATAFSPAPVDFDSASFTVNLSQAGLPGYLQAEGLPLAFEIGAASLSAAGLTGSWSDVHYLYDVAFSGQDPRFLYGAPSNDARFANPSSAPSTDALRQLLITGAGLSSQAAFLAGSGRSHFPATQMRYSDFEVAIADGRLVANQTLPGSAEDRYFFHQSPLCTDCGDPGQLPARAFTLPVEAGQGLGADGAVIAAIAEIGENPAWGPDDGVARMFERSDDADLPGVLYLPGFIAEGTADEGLSVPEVLLGMRVASSDGTVLQPAELFRLASTEARAGNHFMAGLNVGPQWLVDASGAPAVGLGSSLAGRPTVIGFGGVHAPDFEPVDADPGSKYVVRAGGVTGTFGAQNLPQPKLYGYDLSLFRFGFRQIVNAIDPETWMSGVLDIPAPGDFRIVYASMSLRCTGDVDGGRMSRENCGNGSDDNGNGLVDENCDERLLAWQTGYDIQGADFVPADPEQAWCEAGPRVLQTRGYARIRALDDSTTLLAHWSPDGHPDNASISGATNRKLDRPEVSFSSPENEAFEIGLDSAISMNLDATEAHGWYVTQGLMGLHFWDDIPVDVRLQNRTPAEPEQTLVFRQDTLAGIPGQSEVDNGDSTLIAQMAKAPLTHSRALYDWVGTIDFDLPVYYDAGRHDSQLQPRFVGLPEEMDLSMFDGEAGVSFITPQRTKLSFGASADPNRLAAAAENLSLHVDLEDPQSVSNIDAFLEQYLLVPQDPPPVASLVDQVDDIQQELRCYVQGGLDGCAEQRLRNEIVAALGSPDDVVESLQAAQGDVNATKVSSDRTLCGALQTLGAPFQTLQSAGCARRRTPPGGVIPIGMLDNQMVQVYQAVPVAINLQHQVCSPASPGYNVLACGSAPVVNALTMAQTQLVGTATQIAGAQTQLATVQAQVATTRNDIVAFQADLAADLAELDGQLQSARDELAASGLDVCEQALGDDGWLATAGDVSERISGLADKVRDFQPLRLALAFEAAGFDGAKVAQARAAFVAFADDIAAITTPALAALQLLLDCESDDVPNLGAVLDDADGYLADLQSSLGLFEDAFDAFVFRLLQDGDNDMVADPGPNPGLLGLVQQNLADATQVLNVAAAMVAGLNNNINTALSTAPPTPVALPNVGVPTAPPPAAPAMVAAIQNYFDQSLLGVTNNRYRWFNPPPPLSGGPPTSVVIQLQTDTIGNVVANKQLIDAFFLNQIDPLLERLEAFDSGDELVEYLVDLVMNRPAVAAFLEEAETRLSEPLDATVDLSNNLVDRVTVLLRVMLQALGSLRDQVFVFDGIVPRFSPLSRLDELDGHAIINRGELERLHLTTTFDFLHDVRDDLLEAR